MAKPLFIIPKQEVRRFFLMITRKFKTAEQNETITLPINSSVIQKIEHIREEVEKRTVKIKLLIEDSDSKERYGLTNIVLDFSKKKKTISEDFLTPYIKAPLLLNGVEVYSSNKHLFNLLAIYIGYISIDGFLKEPKVRIIDIYKKHGLTYDENIFNDDFVDPLIDQNDLKPKIEQDEYYVEAKSHSGSNDKEFSEPKEKPDNTQCLKEEKQLDFKNDNHEREEDAGKGDKSEVPISLNTKIVTLDAEFSADNSNNYKEKEEYISDPFWKKKLFKMFILLPIEFIAPVLIIIILVYTSDNAEKKEQVGKEDPVSYEEGIETKTKKGNKIFIYKYHDDDDTLKVENNLRHSIKPILEGYGYAVTTKEASIDVDIMEEEREVAKQKAREGGATIVLWGNISGNEVRTYIEFLSSKARKVIKASRIELKEFFYEKGKSFDKDVLYSISLLAKLIVCFEKFYSGDLEEAQRYIDLINLDELRNREHAILLMKMKFFSGFSLAIKNDTCTYDSFLTSASIQLNEILKEKPGDDFSRFYLAVIEVFRGNVNEAIKKYKKVIGSDSKYREQAIYQLGYIYHENPIITISSGIEEHEYIKDDFLKIDNKGISNLDSVVYYWEMLPVRKAYARDIVFLANIYEDRQEHEKEIKKREDYLKINPLDYNSIKRLMFLFNEIGDTVKADSLFRKCININEWIRVVIPRKNMAELVILINRSEILKAKSLHHLLPYEIDSEKEKILRDISYLNGRKLVFFNIYGVLCVYDLTNRRHLIASPYLTQQEIIECGIPELELDLNLQIQ